MDSSFVCPVYNATIHLGEMHFEFSINFLLDNKETFSRIDIVVYQESVDKVKPFIRQRSH